MKKLSTLIIAIALAVGASQCKKNVEPIAPGSDEVVYITMRCDNGGKHHEFHCEHR